MDRNQKVSSHYTKGNIVRLNKTGRLGEIIDWPPDTLQEITVLKKTHLRVSLIDPNNHEGEIIQYWPLKEVRRQNEADLPSTKKHRLADENHDQ